MVIVVRICLNSCLEDKLMIILLFFFDLYIFLICWGKRLWFDCKLWSFILFIHFLNIIAPVPHLKSDQKPTMDTSSNKLINWSALFVDEQAFFFETETVWLKLKATGIWSIFCLLQKKEPLSHNKLRFLKGKISKSEW